MYKQQRHFLSGTTVTLQYNLYKLHLTSYQKQLILFATEMDLTVLMKWPVLFMTYDDSLATHRIKNSILFKLNEQHKKYFNGMATPAS